MTKEQERFEALADKLLSFARSSASKGISSGVNQVAAGLAYLHARGDIILPPPAAPPLFHWLGADAPTA